ncbi:uncharacterized protein ecscr isoform X2 [Myxocyprinus asiaticus]|uniref:uncharacterized protein ecscr isoform X2 n=1 Tax=Myxocyprinus asiaticus TaxID=70543 RepID=UPI002223233F|nr:uncharacterized protein ecscr isoform X2 [Myxocyprinus asiaticus]
MSVKQFGASMEQFFCLLTALIASSSIISAGKDTNILTPSTAPSNTATLSPWPTISSTGVPEIPKTSTPTIHLITLGGMTGGTASPTQTPDDSLTMLAFGVMSLILILIVVMVILVTTINVRGRCRDTNQQEGIKSYNSVVSDSNMTNNCEKESITLVSVRTINPDNDTDSPQLSSVRSTIVDNEDQELNRDLLRIKCGP